MNRDISRDSDVSSYKCKHLRSWQNRLKRRLWVTLGSFWDVFPWQHSFAIKKNIERKNIFLRERFCVCTGTFLKRRPSIWKRCSYPAGPLVGAVGCFGHGSRTVHIRRTTKSDCCFSDCRLLNHQVLQGRCQSAGYTHKKYVLQLSRSAAVAALQNIGTFWHLHRDEWYFNFFKVASWWLGAPLWHKWPASGLLLLPSDTGLWKTLFLKRW